MSGAPARRTRPVLAWLIVGLVVTALAAPVIVDRLAEPAGLPEGIDPGNGRAFTQDSLWSDDDVQYAVWAGESGRPLVARRTGDGPWDVVDLAGLDGNPLGAPVPADPHHNQVVAVDADGGVHVFANMRTSPLRYVRSEPGAWPAFAAGDVDGPGDLVTYPMLAALSDGTLLFFRREGPQTAAGIELDVLAPGSTGWRHAGRVLDGRPTDESVYLHRVAVDPATDAIHLAFVFRDDADPASTNDLAYTVSHDRGRTWRDASGATVTGPLTHDDVEIVIDTPDRGSGLVNSGGLAVDTRGRPHVAVNARDVETVTEHVWLDSDGWRRRALPAGTFQSRVAVAAPPDGSVWLIGTARGRIQLIEVSDGEPGRRIDGPRVPDGWEPTFDAGALEARGTFEFLVPEGDTPVVHVVDP